MSLLCVTTQKSNIVRMPLLCVTTQKSSIVRMPCVVRDNPEEQHRQNVTCCASQPRKAISSECHGLGVITKIFAL
jgi:hypothetical protein